MTKRMDNARDFFCSDYDPDSDKSQCEYILDYMDKYGSITQLEATVAFRCTRLAARIADLRKMGITIETEYNIRGPRYGIYRTEAINGNNV